MLWLRRFGFALALVVGLWFSHPITLRAQITVEGPPIWTSTNFQSVGGITYFVNTARFYNCTFHEFGSVTMVGTNLALPVTRMRSELCWACYDCYVDVTNATVLGNFPGGNYRLNIYSLIPYTYPGTYELTRMMDFQVPADSGRTMTVAREGAGVRIAVNGVPAANYTLQTSTTLTNWTTLTNRSGAPFSFTANLPEGSARFYRVTVTSGSVSY